jgi:hypothetical protein
MKYINLEKNIQNHECLISNELYNLGETKVSQTIKSCMDFYLTMCLCNVRETLGYKIFEV